MIENDAGVEGSLPDLPPGWTRHVDPWGVTIYRDGIPVACVSWCAAGWYWWCQPDAGWHHGTRAASRDEAEAAARAALGLNRALPGDAP